MNEESDPLLAAVAAAARAEAEDTLADPRWDDLARGDLTEEERAELEALATEDPLAAGAPALFAPLDAKTRDLFFETARAQLAASPAAASVEAPIAASASPAAASVAPVAAPASPAAPLPANVVSLDDRRAKRRALVAAVALVATLAAGIVLRLGMDPSGDASLPGYALTVTGGERDVRADVAPVVLSPGSRVVLALRPEKAAQGDIAVRAFLVQPPHAIELPGAVTTSPDGAVRLVARVPEQASLAAGPAEIAVAVGRPDLLGEQPTSMNALERHGTSVRWSRAPVTCLPSSR